MLLEHKYMYTCYNIHVYICINSYNNDYNIVIYIIINCITNYKLSNDGNIDIINMR